MVDQEKHSNLRISEAKEESVFLATYVYGVAVWTEKESFGFIRK